MFRFLQSNDNTPPQNTYSTLQSDDPHSLHQRSKGSILKTGFYGIWSQILPECITPPPRKDCFVVHSTQHNGIFIGYGINEKNELFNDCWFLNLGTYKWSRLTLSGAVVTPRTGARAVLLGDNLVIFGGFAKQNYFADLHRIDINTGIVYPIETTGAAPSPRCTPILTLFGKRLYVWGGFNVNMWPTELHSLNLETFNWDVYPQSVTGRTAVPYVMIDDKVYVYGCSKSGALLVIDMTKNQVTTRSVTGSPPSSLLRSGMMVKGDKYVFFIGGKSPNTDQFMLVYALDVEKNWWFVFHIVPDGETTSVEDGLVSELGLFFMPRVVAAAITYDESRREIVYSLGLPESDPPAINKIAIGEALSILRLRDDMLAILNFN